MNDIRLILTTSGFILPATDYYMVLSSKDIKDPSILNRDMVVSASYTGIGDYVKTGVIYSSETANDYYLKYLDTKSFEDYMNMVDLATEVLSKMDFNKFFEVQANNRNLAPVSFMFCLDLYADTFAHKHLQYATIPLAVRFTNTDNVSTAMVDKNLTSLRSRAVKTNWPIFLARLSENHDSFSTFFKYVFTDAYR